MGRPNLKTLAFLTLTAATVVTLAAQFVTGTAHVYAYFFLMFLSLTLVNSYKTATAAAWVSLMVFWWGAQISPLYQCGAWSVILVLLVECL